MSVETQAKVETLAAALWHIYQRGRYMGTVYDRWEEPSDDGDEEWRDAWRNEAWVLLTELEGS